MTSMAQDDVRAAFDFRRGALQGARFTLYSARLLYQARNCTESIQLGAVGAVRIAFERHARKLGWAVVLALLALLFFAAAGPLASMASGAVTDVRGQLQQNGGNAAHGVAGVVLSGLQLFHVVARFLPIGGALLGVWAIAWAILGWIGATTLTISLGAVERSYRARGRDVQLLDFAEALSTAVTQLRS